MTSPARADYGSADLPHRARQVMTRGNTRSTLFVPPAPPYAMHGRGAYVVDQLGRQVIDANNNYTSLIHGHSQPDIVSAVAGLLDQGTAFGLPTGSEVAFAELLSARTGYQRWRFSNSGTEAVMTAVRAARAYTGRDILIRFRGSYHGTSDAVVSRDAPGVPQGTRNDVVELPQGDREAFDAAIAERGSRIAAVLIDLMPNRAGLEPAAPAFIDHIRQATRSIDALLIIDEVITFRLARGGMAARYGVAPDLVTAGKIVGGGFPVGAVGGRADVLTVFDPMAPSSVGWGGTFSANPITMTAGRVAMDLFDEAEIARLNKAGDALRESLSSSGVAATGSGSLIRLRAQVDPGELWWAAYERGVMIGTNGLIALSTAMTDDDVAMIERACAEAVMSVR